MAGAGRTDCWELMGGGTHFVVELMGVGKVWEGVPQCGRVCPVCVNVQNCGGWVPFVWVGVRCGCQSHMLMMDIQVRICVFISASCGDQYIIPSPTLQQVLCTQVNDKSEVSQN